MLCQPRLCEDFFRDRFGNPISLPNKYEVETTSSRCCVGCSPVNYNILCRSPSLVLYCLFFYLFHECPFHGFITVFLWIFDNSFLHFHKLNSCILFFFRMKIFYRLVKNGSQSMVLKFLWRQNISSYHHGTEWKLNQLIQTHVTSFAKYWAHTIFLTWPIRKNSHLF